MDLVKVGQIAITVDDVASAKEFYEKSLGLRFLFEAPGLAFFDCGGTRLLLGEENATSQAVLLYFTVEDIHATHARLTTNGVAFDAPPRMVAKMPDREIWLAVFRDPAGNVHHLISEPKTSPAS